MTSSASPAPGELWCLAPWSLWSSAASACRQFLRPAALALVLKACGQRLHQRSGFPPLKGSNFSSAGLPQCSTTLVLDHLAIAALNTPLACCSTRPHRCCLACLAHGVTNALLIPCSTTPVLGSFGSRCLRLLASLARCNFGAGNFSAQSLG